MLNVEVALAENNMENNINPTQLTTSSLQDLQINKTEDSASQSSIQQQQFGGEVKIPLSAQIQIISQIYPTNNLVLTPTIIYTAKYKSNDVILKKIVKNKLDQAGKNAALQEQDLQNSLQHVNIVSGVGSYEEDDAYYIVMELVSQADYFTIKLIENYKPIRKMIKIKMYLLDILTGLKYLHDNNIAHLDIKLENLYCEPIEKEGIEIRRVKIGDFGISKKVDPVTKKVKIINICGTRDYMAPEIKPNSEISLACDIWSLGVTLYHMVTGYTPTKVAGFNYEDGAEIPFRKRDWKKIEKGEELQQFIIKMLSFKPENRPTVDQLLDDPYLRS